MENLQQLLLLAEERGILNSIDRIKIENLAKEEYPNCDLCKTELIQKSVAKEVDENVALDKVFTIKEISLLTGVNNRTIIQYIHANKLQDDSFRKSEGTYILTLNALNRIKKLSEKGRHK